MHMHAQSARISSFSLAALLCGIAFLAAPSWSLAADAAKNPAGKPQQERIIKWVDEKGVTHYGDRLPAQLSGRDNSVINQNGVVIKRNQALMPDSSEQINSEQQRRDHTLRAAFTTEEEIDLARDRHLQQDEAALGLLRQQMSNARNRLQGYQQEAKSFAQRNKPVPEDLQQDMQRQQSEISTIEKQIAERNAAMAATRQRFDADKRRFGELKAKEAELTR